MSYKKFTNNDIFFNIIKSKPHYQFKIQNGNILLNNSDGFVYLNSLLVEPPALLASTCDISLDFSCENSQYVAVI
jgi:hypothetical protein